MGAGLRDRSKGVLLLNKKWERYLVSAAAAASVLAASASAHGQVAGLVNASGGSPLPGAVVEVWDAYPSGAILASATTGADGTFSVPAIGAASFDLRLTGDGYYPTVIRDLPHPISNVVATLSSFEGLGSSPLFEDCSDDATTFLGELIQPNDVIEALDAQGIRVGVTQNSLGPGLYLLHILGDFPGGEDEGASTGEEVSFHINGLDASPTLVFVPFSSVGHRLTGAADVPGVTVVGPPDLGVLAGDAVLASFSVTNTGTVEGSFDVDVTIAPPWTVTLISPSSTGPLLPGESVQFDAIVDAPPDAAGVTAILSLTATSDVYAPANCGSITTIDVNSTAVGDDGGSGSMMPTSFSLAQNFPNPFNPETQIAFNVAVAGHTRLEIFNILGQDVAMLVDEYLPAGPVVRQWDGRDRNGTNVPSGIYFYRLSRGQESVTRQMVLLR